MCTLWLIEALSRAGQYEPELRGLATPLLEDLMGYSSHLGLFSEEISKSGQALGNLPQAFSHVALISKLRYNPVALDEDNGRLTVRPSVSFALQAAATTSTASTTSISDFCTNVEHEGPAGCNLVLTGDAPQAGASSCER